MMNSPLFPSEEQLCTAKVLIIDDEDADIRVLEWALKQAKFSDFRSVKDSTQALKEFKQFLPDIVLLDFNMPDLDGFDVLKQLQESRPAGEFLPVLMITGENTAEMRTRALAAGASDFLGKPIDYIEVTLRIRNLLQIRFLHRQAQKIQARVEVLSAGEDHHPPTQSGHK